MRATLQPHRCQATFRVRFRSRHHVCNLPLLLEARALAQEKETEWFPWALKWSRRRRRQVHAVYERDLGPDSATKAEATKSFDPGSG
ncbi:hypothetical protein BN2476_390030 [Paraburkholderia piptadeniae]|uniref:Uncharacterized protein n=1 Tax=Paraburkholderia piptadeniae TaxID=1701573 RepID=A0A1N7SAJ9_9BURK|nr:hypothetical protein BN2476_390030 [Paraburkholderia piptadeniae]